MKFDQELEGITKRHNQIRPDGRVRRKIENDNCSKKSLMKRCKFF